MLQSCNDKRATQSSLADPLADLARRTPEPRMWVGVKLATLCKVILIVDIELQH